MILSKLGQTIKAFISGDPPLDSYTPSPLESPSVEKRHVSFSDLLPYMAWLDKERIFILEGKEEGKIEAMGFCLEMWPQTGATENMADLLATMFSNLPAGAGIQWMMLASPQVDETLERYVELRSISPAEENAELFVKLAKRQAKLYSDGVFKPIVKHQPYLIRQFKLVMSITFPTKDFTNPQELKKITECREGIVQVLTTCHQFRKEWGPEDLINWCSNLLNLQETLAKRNMPYLHYDEGKEIKRQIIFPDTIIRTYENGLRFGLPQTGDEIVATTMTIRSYPQINTLNNMGRLIGDIMQPSMGFSCPYLIMCGIETTDFIKTKEVTTMKSARATQKAASPMARFQPELAKLKEDWDIAQYACDTEGKGMCRMYHEVVLFDKPDSIARSVQNAKAIFRFAQFELVEDAFMQVQGFLSTFPLTMTPAMINDIRLAQRMTTKTVVNSVNLAPLIGEWSGVGDAVVPLGGRRGQMMMLDLFANDTGNYNFTTVGRSGSGKSVFLNLLTLSYLGCGAQVWIIDIGHSYQKLCEQIGGQYIEMSRKNDIRLNPFSMVVDIDEDIEMLTALFAQMCSPSGPLTDHLKAILKAHLLSVWYEGKLNNELPSVDKVQHSLLNNCELGGPNPLENDEEWKNQVANMSHAERQQFCDPRVRDLGMALFPFTTSGNYGRYFVGEANIDFNKALVVLELEELAQIPDLRTVVMFLIMYRITQSMYLMSRSRRKFCLIDEAWQLLDGGATGDFIETGYRRARKYGGAFGTATQSMGDYDRSVAARAALDNADWLFLLAQKPESVEAMLAQKKLVIDDSMKKLLSSIHTRQGSYSEVYVRGGDMGFGVGRILLDPFTLLMMSSKAEDFEAVKAYREAGYPVNEAMEAVLADRQVEGFVHPAHRHNAPAFVDPEHQLQEV
jgi:conjugal transfer ATP-binding protein TraC